MLWSASEPLFARRKKRCQNNGNALSCFWQQIGVYGLYAHEDSITTFPIMRGFQEQRILTSGRTVPEATEEIMRKSSL